MSVLISAFIATVKKGAGHSAECPAFNLSAAGRPPFRDSRLPAIILKHIQKSFIIYP